MLIEDSATTEAVYLVEALPYSLADRWRRGHRWALRHPSATPDQVADFFAAWDEPIGCGECQSHYQQLKRDIRPDLSSAEGLASTLHKWHNAVNAQLGRAVWTREECDRIHGMPAVGFLSASLLTMGGTETWNETILPRLERVRIEGLVVMGECKGRPRFKCRLGVGVHAAKQLAERVDVLITWGVPDVARLLPAVDRPAVVVTHHGDLNNKWFDQFIMQQQEAIDCVVAINPTVAKHAREQLQTRVEYIPNAVDPERIKPTIDLSNHPMVKGRKVVVWCARFSPEKRVHLAIAVARVMPDWTFVLIGGGNYRKDELPANVIMPGMLPNQADWLAVADAFLSTADQEGFGLSMAEAMLAGVPVVATPAGLGTDKSLVYQVPMDAKPCAIAEALRFAVAHAAKAQAASRLMRENHAVEAVVGQWERLIASLTPQARFFDRSPHVDLLGC